MRLIVAREGGRLRAWFTPDPICRGDEFHMFHAVELDGVESIIGCDLATAQRMNYPTDVYVRFAYGSVTFPRDRVTIKGDGLPLLDDGKTVEGQQ